MTYATEVLADTPLGYWKLDETSGTTLVDASGNNHDGTYTGSPTLNQTPLLIGSTASATFTSSHGDVAGGAWQNAAEFTIEGWIKPTGVGGNYCWASRDTNVARSFDMFIWFGQIRFDLPGLYPGTYSLNATTTAVGGTIYHVVGTHDATTARIYVNGVLEASMASVTHNDNNSPLVVGDTNIGTSSTYYYPFYGGIDEVAYYDHALSGARIAAHYAAGTGGLDASAALAITVSRSATGHLPVTSAAATLPVTVTTAAVAYLDTPVKDVDADLPVTVTTAAVGSIAGQYTGISDTLISCTGQIDYDPDLIEPADADYDPATVAPPNRLRRVDDYVIHVTRETV